MSVIRILIVDDHQVIRRGVRTMLAEGGDEFALVGEAAAGATAIRLAGELQPNVVLMDLRMPGMAGMEAIQQIRQQWPTIAILILTTYNEDELMIQGLQAGACGYLLKDVDLDALLHAIRRAAQGETVLPPEVREHLLAHAARGLQQPPSLSRQGVLTEREKEVLLGVALGERTKEIARRLGLTPRTVETYLTTIYTKLGVDSRTAAVVVALERGILPPL
jgi:NarL family two-component system response regulator YdfI